MKPIVELLAFTATEEFMADNSLAAAPVEYVKKLDGFIKGFRGFSVEDPSQAHFFIIWDSFASFEAAGKREDFPAFRESLKSTVKGKPNLRHAEFDEDATNAFSAPVTEYSIVKPKEGTTQAEIDAIIASMKEAAPAVPGSHSPLAWGPIKQSPELYALAAGWDSVEAHKNSLTVSPIAVLGPKLFDIAEVTVVHATLVPM